MKAERHAAILETIHANRVNSQEELRRLLSAKNFRVTQTTLSRDLRELRVAKVPGAGGPSYYAPAPDSSADSPGLESLLPQLMLSVEGVGNLVVLRTVTGAAQAVAEAIDLVDFPEIMGTVAGDDTILIVIREEAQRNPLLRRLSAIGGR